MNDANTRPSFSDDDLRREADKQGVRPETVLRALAGLPVRGRAGARAARAVAALLARPGDVAA